MCSGRPRRPSACAVGDAANPRRAPVARPRAFGRASSWRVGGPSLGPGPSAGPRRTDHLDTHFVAGAKCGCPSSFPRPSVAHSLCFARAGCDPARLWWALCARGVSGASCSDRRGAPRRTRRVAPRVRVGRSLLGPGPSAGPRQGEGTGRHVLGPGPAAGPRRGEGRDAMCSAPGPAAGPRRGVCSSRISTAPRRLPRRALRRGGDEPCAGRRGRCPASPSGRQRGVRCGVAWRGPRR